MDGGLDAFAAVGGGVVVAELDGFVIAFGRSGWYERLELACGWTGLMKGFLVVGGFTKGLTGLCLWLLVLARSVSLSSLISGRR